ncbi:Yar1p NDAI_0F01320 [Naumovozyma dairenensis CBS 421]|uniref:Uncharacterized protein n=1 Tax=Naumovozyma dairenensis (strain ATCC 10597 / BCRC 20456 / CBS 421 / NBRC 0211 / NRRL Y-12639) TaxID=1071378 RepID=G0WCE0_NAUDC|nr:hypothetical protein NDAI_0F01320 [Naumovozyma dairenensis CBS 421]CCD25451.1 hypothetical protein NDAI_0F01320 [Naumovozyma dairenensis CBS 421]
MSTLHTEPLEQEDQDAIILDARSGDLESLKDIFTTLIHPKLLLTIKDSETKSTPLHMAAGNGHVEVIKYLLSLIEGKENQTKYINQVNDTGNTALHWAALNGKLDVVELICEEYDADPFIRNQFGHDAIFEAENNGKEDVETYFLKKYDVEPENDDEDDNGEESTEDNNTEEGESFHVETKEGHEIEQVTKEATEALRERTEKLASNKTSSTYFHRYIF